MAIVRHYLMTSNDGEAAALEKALLELASSVRALPGCSEVQLLADLGRDGTFMFMEHWHSEEDQKAAGLALGKDAFGPVMATLAAPPEGSWYKLLVPTVA